MYLIKRRLTERSCKKSTSVAYLLTSQYKLDTNEEELLSITEALLV